MIKIKNLTVSFDDQTILENINLTIPENEITVIVGESGCGKTVLMKTVEGLYQPDAGEILIDDKEIFSLKRKEVQKIRQQMAMLFQNSALFDSMNIFQNVALPLYEHSKKTDAEIREIVEQKLRLVGLENILIKMPSNLSGGMKKRVALARAIILEPKYIIYDEPTTGLDPSIASDIIGLIRRIHKTLQITSIVITHDLECIKKINGKMVMINDRKIIFDGNYSDFKNAERKEIKRFLRLE